MKSAIITFPGINRQSDMIKALHDITGNAPQQIWHTETELPKTDLIVIPGGFSFGDYLRCGAIAGRSPVMTEIIAASKRGVRVLGVCNGFQILVETELLPGALMRNAHIKFVCRNIRLKINNNETFLTNKMKHGDVVTCPVAHGDGNYFATEEKLKQLEGEGRVVFRYAEGTNPNGSLNDIAGVVNRSGNVIGLMPHPENMIEPLHGTSDCRPLFESLIAA
jgi:phosphoribosylformylglycinamidine synthase I